MRIRSPYSTTQSWLKGNLHTHTSLSDGALEPQDVIAAYRDDGYDFLAITDHNRVYDPDEKAAGEMLLLKGAECNLLSSDFASDPHILCLGIDQAVEPAESLQEIIDRTNELGGLAIVAHPRWSFMPYELFDNLSGYVAFEVYNGGCDKEVTRGHAVDYWDRHMTLHGKKLWGVAVDDSHSMKADFASGWVFVNAEKTPESIFGALRRGDFYSTSGPRIERIEVDEKSITVRTSSAKLVKFSSRHGEAAATVEGRHVKVATYEPKGDELYVRVEVYGHDGRAAWTNPFMIES